MERAPDACIICGTQEAELLIQKEHWRVYRCAHCGLGFLDPRPSQEEIAELYRGEYFSTHYDPGLDPGSSEFRRRLRSEDHRIRFIKRAKKTGRLLDIGCGYGYFLAACRKQGYNVAGLDVSEWAVQYATQKLGLPLSTGKFGDIKYPSRCFDIITMWHSLEHAPNPHLALQEAKSWLRPDGILVIDVPDYEGTDAQRNWQDWDGWSLPYHLWHFTFKTLTLLLRTHGFKVIKSKNYHSDTVKKKLASIPLLKLFARPIAKLYSGTSVAVISKPES
jgi:2-polyprenyl-3-methyl-5-hydroxy-6-metoxy-1,4-benzoquinol methylase